MPHYNYNCFKCNKEFEIYQRITEEPLKECPYCGGNEIKRLMGKGGGIIFKGSGFYETDYKNKSGKISTPKPATTCPSASNSSECKQCALNKTS